MTSRTTIPQNYMGNLAAFDIDEFKKPADAEALVNNLIGAAQQGCGDFYLAQFSMICAQIVGSYAHAENKNNYKLCLLWDELLARYERLLNASDPANGKVPDAHFYVRPDFMAVQTASGILAGTCIATLNLRGEKNALLPILGALGFSDREPHRQSHLGYYKNLYKNIKAAHSRIAATPNAVPGALPARPGFAGAAATRHFQLPTPVATRPAAKKPEPASAPPPAASRGPVFPFTPPGRKGLTFDAPPRARGGRK
jgi:hypothetical protein